MSAMTDLSRRELLAAAGAACACAIVPAGLVAQERRFAPEPGPWRSFELTTRVELAKVSGASRVWLPLPSVDSDYQQSLENSWSGNAATTQDVANLCFTGAANGVAD